MSYTFLGKPVKVDTNNQVFNNAGKFLGVIFTERDGTKHLIGKGHKGIIETNEK